MSVKKRKKKKSEKKANGMGYIAKTVGIASLIGTAVFFILCAAAALIIFKKDIEPSVLPAVFYAICGLSGIICGFAAVRPVKHNGLILGMTGALPAYFIVFLILSIINRSPVSSTGWISLGIMTICGGAGGILGNKK